MFFFNPCLYFNIIEEWFITFCCKSLGTLAAPIDASATDVIGVATLLVACLGDAVFWIACNFGLWIVYGEKIIGAFSVISPTAIALKIFFLWNNERLFTKRLIIITMVDFKIYHRSFDNAHRREDDNYFWKHFINLNLTFGTCTTSTLKLILMM